jgi:hypothetical protein
VAIDAALVPANDGRASCDDSRPAVIAPVSGSRNNIVASSRGASTDVSPPAAAAIVTSPSPPRVVASPAAPTRGVVSPSAMSVRLA